MERLELGAIIRYHELCENPAYKKLTVSLRGILFVENSLLFIFNVDGFQRAEKQCKMNFP